MRKTPAEHVADMNAYVKALQTMLAVAPLSAKDSKISIAMEALNETNLTRKIALLRQAGCINDACDTLIKTIKIKITLDGLIAPNPIKMLGAMNALQQNDLEGALIAYRTAMAPATSDTTSDDSSDTDDEVVVNHGQVAPSAAGMFADTARAASHVETLDSDDEESSAKPNGSAQQ